MTLRELLLSIWTREHVEAYQAIWAQSKWHSHIAFNHDRQALHLASSVICYYDHRNNRDDVMPIGSLEIHNKAWDILDCDVEIMETYMF